MPRLVFPLVALCLAVACRAQSGVLIVESMPERAAVDVDSVRVGRAPLMHAVVAGAHRVTVRYAGFTPFDRTVTVAAGDTLVVRADLERQTGRVVLRDLPDGATVTVNGSPDAGDAVPTGEATVVVAAPGVRDARAVVRVVPGAETVVEYRPRTFDASKLWGPLVVPGSAQLAGGRPLVGAALVVAVAAGVGSAVRSGNAARRAAEATDAAYLVYLDETTEDGAVAAWAGVEREVAREAHARRLVVASLVAAAAVHLVGVLDAAVHHARSPGLRALAPRPVVTSGPAGAAGLGLALSF